MSSLREEIERERDNAHSWMRSETEEYLYTAGDFSGVLSTLRKHADHVNSLFPNKLYLSIRGSDVIQGGIASQGRVTTTLEYNLNSSEVRAVRGTTLRISKSYHPLEDD